MSFSERCTNSSIPSDLPQEVYPQVPNFLSADVYVEWLSNTEASHYVQFPEILHHLTYTDTSTGKIVRLSHSSKILYMMYRQIAGQSDIGKCWKNSEEIAEEIGMSEKTLRTCRQELSQKFHQLDGTSLITLEKCQKTVYEKNSEKRICKTFYYKVGIPNIWGYNRAFMNSRIMAKKVGVMNMQEEKITDCPEAEGKNCREPQGEQPAKITAKQETYNNTQMFKEQHSTPAALGVAFSLNKRRMFCSDAHARTYNWLLYELPDHERPKESIAFKIVTTYDPYDIELASKYITDIRKRHRRKHGTEFVFEKGFVAYLQYVLKNKCYINRSILR